MGTINGQVKCSAHISLAHSLAPVYSVTLSSAILDTTPISLIETKNGSYVHSGDINYTFSDDTYVEIVNHQIVWKDPSVRPHESLNCSVSANASGIDIMTQPFVLMPDTSSNYEIEVSTHSIQYGHTIDNEVELDLLLNDAEVLSSDYTLDFQVSGGYDNISLFLDGDQ
ncbi:hypothetical protein FACS1894166_13050 [Bacilli bacterium]|nr:hypothetical protein FACS1894166_13050 [Bacilli bacterium]